MLGLVLYQMFKSYVAEDQRVRLQYLQNNVFRVRLTVKTCNKDSSFILIGDKTVHETNTYNVKLVHHFNVTLII